MKKDKDLRYIKQEVEDLNVTFRKINISMCEIFCNVETLAEMWRRGFKVYAKNKRDKRCRLCSPFINITDYSTLLGWILSEGSLYESTVKKYETATRGKTFIIGVSQYKDHNPIFYKEIDDLLTKMEIPHSKNSKCISFCSDLWYNHLMQCGKYSYQKHVIDELFPYIDKAAFFASLYKGDGHKKIHKYTTNSKRLCEQVILVLTELGYRSWFRYQECDKCYRIIFQDEGTRFHRVNIRHEKNNSDKVYCIEVEDNHTVLAGRNNKFNWTGQSFFGFLGFKGSRLYKKEVAAAITLLGREIILHTKNKSEELDYKVLYSDTDSVYVQAQVTSLPMMVAEGKGLAKFLTDSYVDFAKAINSNECTLEMQYEKAMSRMMFFAKRGEEKGAKKKYAFILIWKDGNPTDNEIEFSGLASVRSDTPRVGRKIEKDVITRILRGESKESVVEYLKDLDKKIRKREIPDEEIGFPKGISDKLENYGKVKKEKGKKDRKTGTPPVIKGVLYSNKFLGTRFGMGSKPKWIYVKKVPVGYPFTDIISYETEIPAGFVPDFDKMTERIFKYKLEEAFRSAYWGDFPELHRKNNSIG